MDVSVFSFSYARTCINFFLFSLKFSLFRSSNSTQLKLKVLKQIYYERATFIRHVGIAQFDIKNEICFNFKEIILLVYLPVSAELARHASPIPFTDFNRITKERPVPSYWPSCSSFPTSIFQIKIQFQLETVPQIPSHSYYLFYYKSNQLCYITSIHLFKQILVKFKLILKNIFQN